MDDKNNPGFFTGDIQDVHFYDHVLSAEEILAIWNAGNRKPWYKRLWQWISHHLKFR